MWEGCSFLHFHYFCYDRAQDPKNEPRCLPKWSQVGHLGVQVGQHSAILVSFWPNLGHLGDKISPKTSPNGAPYLIQLASWAILAPRWSPKCSKTAPKLDFIRFSTDSDTILDAFSLTFHVHVSRISTSILPSMFICSCSISCLNPKLQPLARHGGGLARAAHWMCYGMTNVIINSKRW